MNELRDKELAGIELLLRERIGLNPQAVGKHHIRDAVRQRLTVHTGEGLAGYLERVRSQEGEFQELVELLIVPESWFFRDLLPFRCLEHYLSTRLQRHQSLRLLSVPCGTGEEPFSMAMTLLNAGFDPAKIRVDALDISQRVLQQASEGAYGDLSFREREAAVPGYRDRFFHSADQRLVVNEEVRATVHFRQGNIVAADFLHGEAPYHVIFCRNLLIYLDARARRLALANLRRLLRDDGLLYVGHVEAAAVPDELFDAYGNGFPFAFQPASVGSAAGTSEDAVVDAAARTAPAVFPAPAGATMPQKPRTPAPTTPPVADPSAEFDRARQAADRGQLAEAQAHCRELLTRYPPRAEVYCLLGVVHQAQGDLAEAEKCFHKALYLDPRHHETLIHAALLARQRGEEQLALNYHRRAEKTRAGE